MTNHVVFTSGQFIYDPQLKYFVSSLIADPNASLPLSEGMLNGRVVNYEEMNFFIGIIQKIALCLQWVWHHLQNIFSSSYREAFERAVFIITTANDAPNQQLKIQELQQEIECLKEEFERLKECLNQKENELENADLAKTMLRIKRQKEALSAFERAKIDFEKSKTNILEDIGRVFSSEFNQRKRQEELQARNFKEATEKTLEEVFAGIPVIKNNVVDLKLIMETIQEAEEKIHDKGENVIHLLERICQAPEAWELSVVQLKQEHAELEGQIAEIKNEFLEKNEILREIDPSLAFENLDGNVNTPIRLSPLERMLNDFEVYAHPEIAEIWRLIFDLFPDEDLIEKWHIDKNEGTFTLRLKKAFAVWVPNDEFVGSMLLFGVNTNKCLTGRFVNETWILPEDQRKNLEHTLQEKSEYIQTTDEHILAPWIPHKQRGIPSGVIFDKEPHSGFQIYLHTQVLFATVKPHLEVEHFLRIGHIDETRLTERNIAMTTRAPTSLKGGALSVDYIKDLWVGKWLPLIDPSGHLNLGQYSTKLEENNKFFKN